MSRSPAAISPEAEAFIANLEPADTPYQPDQPMAAIREALHEAQAPSIELALRKYPVEYEDVEIAGVQCMNVHSTTHAVNNAGTILYFFGGGFMVGSPYEDLPIIAALADKTGARVVAPYYRLAPEHPFPAALDDCFAVSCELATRGRYCLAGESAGGNLALSVAQRLRQSDQQMPEAIAALSPASDLNDYGDSGLADRDPMLKKAETKGVEAAYLAGQDPTNPEISPVFGPFDPAFPPTIITTGTRDFLLSSCVRLARVMREAGTAVDLRVWEGMWHVFEFYPEIPEADASLSEIADYLRPHLE